MRSDNQTTTNSESAFGLHFIYFVLFSYLNRDDFEFAYCEVVRIKLFAGYVLSSQSEFIRLYIEWAMTDEIEMGNPD